MSWTTKPNEYIGLCGEGVHVAWTTEPRGAGAPQPTGLSPPQLWQLAHTSLTICSHCRYTDCARGKTCFPISLKVYVGCLGIEQFTGLSLWVPREWLNLDQVPNIYRLTAIRGASSCENVTFSFGAPLNGMRRRAISRRRAIPRRVVTR